VLARAHKARPPIVISKIILTGAVFGPTPATTAKTTTQATTKTPTICKRPADDSGTPSKYDVRDTNGMDDGVKPGMLEEVANMNGWGLPGVLLHNQDKIGDRPDALYFCDTSSGGGGPERRKGFAKGRSFGGLACWAWVLPWVLLVLGGMEGVKGVPIPDGDCGGYGDRNCAIKQAVDAYITSGATGSYGPIEDWNTSLVTDMSMVFYQKTTFNANISAWQVGKVTTMVGSTYTLFSPLSKIGSVFGYFSFPSFFVFALIIFSLLFFFQPHFYRWTFLC
jgi:hypothetical protein